MPLTLAGWLNRHLDRVPRLTMHWGGRRRSAFQTCGYVGLGLAVVLVLGLVVVGGLNGWVMALIIVAAVLTFYAVAFGTRLVSGQESLTYYHHQGAVLGVAGLVLWRAGEPLLPYLDLTLLGVMEFLRWGDWAACWWGVVMVARRPGEWSMGRRILVSVWRLIM